ncbi:arginine N-methyltransferase 2 [Plectosphaerella plurivora]|uniref:Arginine N-methyltransferase 2 n=1 Tax=Plectosphaerella plurivora TaxID=936078 RepID=A0A9P8VF37_9PEZI|nr:arginine N-methyltransferase 2 [Plectosphaerella plurivora]
MAKPIDDSMQSRISADCPDDIRLILYDAWAHDTADLKKILDQPGKASVQDPTTGETPLHAAIRACGPSPFLGVSEEDAVDIDDTVAQEAAETVHELFLSGAIWNDVDNNDETPGCVALRLGQKKLYTLCVEAGNRAELLFDLLGGYETLLSDTEEALRSVDGESGDEEEAGGASVVDKEAETGDKKPEAEDKKPETEAETENEAGPDAKRQKTTDDDAAPEPEEDVNSKQYLASDLTYDDSKLTDAQGNGVMMAWETDIMCRSVSALLRDDPAPSTNGPSDAPLAEGKRILNIGFGMGIIDGMFAATKPARHHIIEAHPAVLAHIDSGRTDFGAGWETNAPEPGAYKVHRGRWQDIVPKLLEAGEVYDAIYFDTFGEDYSELKKFFTEMIPGILDFGGRFGFFNGLGADRRICYDVYTNVVEMHMAEAGMDIAWEEIDVDMKGMEEAGQGEWKGVRRRYWTLDRYRLPICTFMG